MKTTNLLLLVGGAGVGLYLLTRRRRGPQPPQVIVTGSPVSKPSKEDKWMGFAAGILPGLFEASASVINTAISQPTVNEAAPPVMKVDYSDVQSPAEDPLWGWDTGLDGVASELRGYAGATPPGGLHGYMGSLGAYGGLAGTLYGSY